VKRPPHLVRDESGYPSLLDLIRRSGRQAVLVGGTVAALSGGAGCESADPASQVDGWTVEDLGQMPDPRDAAIAVDPGLVDPGPVVPDVAGIFDAGSPPDDGGANLEGDVWLGGFDPGPMPDAGDLVTGADSETLADPDAEEVTGDEADGTDDATTDAASRESDAPDDEPAA